MVDVIYMRLRVLSNDIEKKACKKSFTLTELFDVFQCPTINLEGERMKTQEQPIILRIPCSRELLKKRYRKMFVGMDRYMKHYMAAMRRTNRKTASRCADSTI